MQSTPEHTLTPAWVGIILTAVGMAAAGLWFLVKSGAKAGEKLAQIDDLARRVAELERERDA